MVKKNLCILHAEICFSFWYIVGAIFEKFCVDILLIFKIKPFTFLKYKYDFMKIDIKVNKYKVFIVQTVRKTKTPFHWNKSH